MERQGEIAELAETIVLTQDQKRELACMALKLDEPWQEVIDEALSELRSIRRVSCAECSTCMAPVVWEDSLRRN